MESPQYPQEQYLPADVYEGILKCVDDAGDWSALACVCRMANHTAEKWPNRRRELANPLWRFLTLFPNENHDMEKLSESRWLTIPLMKHFPLDWNIRSVSYRIPIEEIINHPEYPWDYKMMSHRSDLTIEFLISHKDCPFDWRYIPVNHELSLEDILGHPELPWNYSRVLCRADITTEILVKYSHLPWVIDSYSFLANGKISLEWVISQSKDFPAVLTQTPYNGTFYIYNARDLLTSVLAHPEYPWDYTQVSQNPYVKIKDIVNNHLPWDFHAISGAIMSSNWECV